MDRPGAAPQTRFSLLVGTCLLLLTAGAGAAQADDTGSRILDSRSRDVIHRNVPSLQSIVPGGNRTTSRSLSGMIGDLEAASGSGRSMGTGSGYRGLDCVLHHERLERTTRQLFPGACDPTVDQDTGYPAFTTR